MRLALFLQKKRRGLHPPSTVLVLIVTQAAKIRSKNLCVQVFLCLQTEVCEQEDARNDAVPAPRFETVFFDDADEEFHRHQGHQKGHHDTHQEDGQILRRCHHHFDARQALSFSAPLFYKQRVSGHRQHGGYGQEKRKFSGCLA